MCRHFRTLATAGLDPDTAAAYALKWTAGTVQPFDVSALPTAALRGSADGTTVSREMQPMPKALEQNLTNLFSSGDALYMSLLLHCPQQADTASRDTQVRRSYRC